MAQQGAMVIDATSRFTRMLIALVGEEELTHVQEDIMKISQLFPSKYVKAADLEGRNVTLTIAKMVVEKMGHGAEEETKPVLYFQKATKGLVLNRTNAMIIATLYGDESNDWAGKRITIYPTKVRAFGSTTDCIRVREDAPPEPRQTKGPIPAEPEPEPEIDDAEDVTDIDEGNAPEPTTDSLGDVLFGRTQDKSKESPPHQRMWGIGQSVFGLDWDMARPWLLKKWTEIQTLGENIRSSAGDLSDTEKDLFGDYLKDKATDLQKIWPAQKAKMRRAQQPEQVAA